MRFGEAAAACVKGHDTFELRGLGKMSDQKLAPQNESIRVPEFAVYSLLKSSTVTIRETYCQGSCRHHSPEECTTTTQLVFPYRGVYVRHVFQLPTSFVQGL